MRKAVSIYRTAQRSPNLALLQRCFWVGALLLGIFLLVAYHNTFLVPFLLDDEDSISANPTLQSWLTSLLPPTHSGATVSGRPLLNLSFSVNYHLHGTYVLGYHVGNLLIHFLGSVCFFALVRRIFAKTVATHQRDNSTVWAWFAAALWMLHPLQTESVTYIAQRAELLAGLCFLLALYTFVRGIDEKSNSWLIISGLVCFIGMGAKEVMATAPIIILLYDRTFVSGSFIEAWQKRRRYYLALSASWIFLLGLVLASGSRGATVAGGGVKWWEYGLTQSVGILIYFLKALVPLNLVFDYGIVVEKRGWLIAGSLLLIGVVLMYIYRSLRLKKPAGFLGAWFFIILAPSSSVVAIATQTLAEHRMYLPLAAVTVGATILMRRFAKRTGIGILALVVVALAAATEMRNRDYQTARSLWEDTVAKVPYNARALSSLALIDLNEDRIDDAVVLLSQAAKNAENEPDIRANLGLALLRKGLQQISPPEATRTVLGNEPPSSFPQADLAFLNRGLEELRTSVLLRPANAAALAPIIAWRAGWAAEVGLVDAAEILYGEATKFAPKNAEYRLKHGVQLRHLNRLDEATKELKSAISLAPDDSHAHANLGAVLAQGGAADEAVSELKEALRIEPDFPEALFYLGEIMAMTGRDAEAISCYERLVVVAKPTAQQLTNLGALYARNGRLREALRETKAALALDPNFEPAQQNYAKIQESLSGQ